MRILRLFYRDGDDGCERTLAMLRDIVTERDDVVLLVHEVEHTPSRLPVLVVDGSRVIRGEPHHPDEILEP